MIQEILENGRFKIVLLAIFLASCSNNPTTNSQRELPSTEISSESIPTSPTFQSDNPLEVIPTIPPAGINRRVEVEDGISFPQLLPFDGIRPVYNPEFETADNVSLQEDELIIGISLGGEAKAYPITVLRFREMVDDQLAGIPILVTW